MSKKKQNKNPKPPTVDGVPVTTDSLLGGAIDWDDPAHATTTRTEANGGLERAVDQVVLDAEMVKVRINVSINQHIAGDEVTVDRDHPFYSGLINQRLAEVID